MSGWPDGAAEWNHRRGLRIREMVEEQQVFLGVTAIVVSPAMRQVMELVKRAARMPAAILITGETGTGKEVVARAVHHYSLRVSRPWIDFNCAALPEHLVESELFGHEKGAFSGADTLKPGLFEMAHTGTIFLDEVGELDPRVQVKLLRVLDGVPYYRVGGQKKIGVDARIVAATNQDLAEASAARRFRSDLYYRLNQCQIRVPALRERPEDIVPIAQYFLRQHAAEAEFSPAARKALEGHPWPGNIRELRNVVTHAMVAARGYQIGVEDLPPLQSGGVRPTLVRSVWGLENLEREAILTALRKTNGHHRRTAEMLGISRRTLSRKLKLYRSLAVEDSIHVA